jgi:YD repeat-containing protein
LETSVEGPGPIGNGKGATDNQGPDYGYIWDQLGRLTTVTDNPTTPSAGTASQENVYGMDRDRIRASSRTELLGGG